MGLYCGIVFGCDPIIHRMSEVRGRRDAVGCPGVFGPVWSRRPSWSRLASSVAGQRLSDISIKQFNDPAWVRVPRARWGVGVSWGAGARRGSREMAPADWPSGRRVSGGRCVVKGWVFCAGRTVRCLSVDRVIQRCVEVPIGVTPWRRFVAARRFSKLFVGS